MMQRIWMRQAWFLFACWSLAVAATINLQAATVQKVQTENGLRWVLENDLVRMQIDPARGARIDQFHDKAYSDPLIRNPMTQGLYIDHITEQRWPGEFWERVYEVRAIQGDDGEVALHTWTTIEGAFRNSRQPQVAGIVLHKTFHLRDGERGVRVVHEAVNATDEFKLFSLWVQNILQLGPEPSGNIAARPASAGVYRFIFTDQPKGETWSRYRDSTDAWQAMIDPVSGQSVVFFQDYDYLESHYNAGKAFTTEWFMGSVSLPPGKSWRTESQMVCHVHPVSLMAASPQHWLAAELDKDQKTLHWTLGATGKVRVVGQMQAQEGVTEEIDLTIEPGRSTFVLPNSIQPPFFIVGRVVHEGQATRFNEFFGGEFFPKNEPLPGYPPLFELRPPDKQPKFLKPDHITLAPNAKQRLLLIEGIHGTSLKDELQAAGYEVTTGYERFTAAQQTLIGFPIDYPTLMSYGLVLFNHADMRLLTMPQREMLKDYLQAGGRVLVIGSSLSNDDIRRQTPLLSESDWMILNTSENQEPSNRPVIKQAVWGEGRIVALIANRASSALVHETVEQLAP